MDSFATQDLAAAREGFGRLVLEQPADSEAVSMLARTEQAIARRAADLAEQATRALRAGSLAQAATWIAQAEALDRGAPGVAQAKLALAGARQQSGRRGSGRGSGTPGPERPAAVRPRGRGALPARLVQALRAQRSEDASATGSWCGRRGPTIARSPATSSAST